MFRLFIILTLLKYLSSSDAAFAKMDDHKDQFPCPSGLVLTPDREVQNLPLAECFPYEGFASFNVPYYFTYYDGGDFEDSIRQTLQSLGFSFNPENFRRAPPAECNSTDDTGSSKYFWTDWLVINEELLNDFALQQSSFDVSLNEKHQYRVQIYGCFSGGTSVRYVQVPGDECLFRQTPAQDGPNSSLTSFVDVQHRGSGGLWRAYEDQEFDSAPLLASVDAHLDSAVASVDPKTIRAAEFRICEDG